MQFLSNKNNIAAHMTPILDTNPTRYLLHKMIPDPNLLEIERLYRQAFAEFGAIALWSSRPVEHPTPQAALAITESLRVEGNLAARRLAERIEELCRAALQSAT